MRGRESPLLLLTMIKEKHVRKLAEQQLDGSDKFVVQVMVKPGNKIMVFIDGDGEVTVGDCVAVSRAIEGNLNRDEEDFHLTVSSAGLDMPFSLMRQYKKYINRAIKVELMDGSKMTGILTEITDKELGIKELTKKQKNKKAEAGPEQRLALNEIKETKPAVTFSK